MYCISIPSVLYCVDQLHQFLRDAQVQNNLILSQHIEDRRAEAVHMSQELEMHMVKSRKIPPGRNIQLRYMLMHIIISQE